MAILIQDARIVDPQSRWDGQGAVLVDEGRILEVNRKLPPREDWEIVDASGLILTPGLIDMHVHLREPGREDEETIESGCLGAVAGGFTSIACMPNTEPVNDSETVTRFIVEKARAAGLSNVYPVGAISRGSRGEKLAEIGEMVKAGARAISDDGQPVMNAQLMRRAMEYANMCHVPVIDHCEDKQLAAAGAMNEGHASARLGLRGIHCCAEDVQVARDLILAEVTGARVHIAHLSSGRSLELVALSRKKSIAVTCEVTPHHFTLADEDIVDYDPNFKMNPPLRSRADLKALLGGLADGTVDAIASDHAPHNPNEKMLDFESAPFGILGLETTLPLTITHLIDRKVIGWPRLAELLSANPARILGLKTKGSLKKGNDADITLIDPNFSWTIDGARFHSRSRNTPFNGWQVHGRCAGTMVAGRWVYMSEEFTGREKPVRRRQTAGMVAGRKSKVASRRS